MFKRNWKLPEPAALRHWGMELLVVMAGVLLALAAQSWFEGRKEARMLAINERAVRDEMRYNLGTSVVHASLGSCKESAVAAYRQAVLAAGETWPGLLEAAGQGIGTGGSFYPLPLYSFRTEAWDAALASGTLDAMDREQFNDYLDAYTVIRILAAWEEREGAARDGLSGLLYPGTMTPEIRLDALRDLDALDRNLQLRSRMALLESFAPLELENDAELDAMLVTWRQVLREDGFEGCGAAVVNPLAAAR